MNKTYIIAEAGVNHNGDVNMAKQLIIKAKEIGADCVKFQTYKTEQLVTESAPKAKYQLEVTEKSESQFDMLKKLELSADHYKILLKCCQENKIDFLSTPYNNEDADFLDSLGVNGFKIASGQLTELPFLRYVARKGKTMIISTGMGTMSDVFDAVEVIRTEGNNDIVVLQCTTNYPSKIEDANLRAMNSMKEACKVRVGYSDHVENNYACLAAVALGAEIIEKHFTLDRTLPGPDHSSSLEPAEFEELIKGIRNTELCLGSGLKKPTVTEVANSFGMKRSMVLLCDLKAGSILKEKNIGFKRPNSGLSPNLLMSVIGKSLTKDMKKDEAIQYSSINWA